MKYGRLGKLIIAAALSVSAVNGIKAAGVSAEEASPVNNDPANVLKGDLNGDGVVNIFDLIRCTRIFLDDITPDEDTVYRADTNDDGVINSCDIVALKKYLFGEIPLNNETADPASVLLYKAAGTGKERPADYKPDALYSYYYHEYDFSSDYIKCLRDKDFQKTVSREISAAAKGHHIDDVRITIINGYMNVKLVSGEKKQDDGLYSYSYVTNLNYDLRTNTKIEKFSDLFYKDEEFVPLVNESIGAAADTKYSGLLNTDFIGLCGQTANFSLGDVVFESGGSYFSDTVSVPFSNAATPGTGCDNYAGYVLDDSMVIWEYFDNFQVLEDWAVCQDCKKAEWYDSSEPDENGDSRVTVNGSLFHTENEKSERQSAYDRVFEAAKSIRSEEYGDENAKIKIADSTITGYMNTYYSENSLKVFYVDYELTDDFFDTRFMFDQVTGERVYLSDIFGKKFEKFDHKTTYVYSLDVRNGMLGLITDPDTLAKEKWTFDPKDANMNYLIMPSGDVNVYEFEKPLTGMVLGHAIADEPLFGMSSSFVLDYGPEQKEYEITGNWNVISKRKCRSHGYTWFECYDADDGDYYGWFADRYAF